jgi:SAM-dependent methyltransferase
VSHITLSGLIDDGSCPVCESIAKEKWASERGFDVYRCMGCRFLYLSPMVRSDDLQVAVRNGHHAALGLDVKSRRIARKVRRYKRLLHPVLAALRAGDRSVQWIDVGCGYGELLEAVSASLPRDSVSLGFEPMTHKAMQARARGLTVVNDYLPHNSYSADAISMMDIFSHVPDFRGLLRVAASNLKRGGYLIIETGNLADLEYRDEAPGELGLPDHLTFAGESHIQRLLSDTGFAIDSITRIRIDGAVETLKNIAKMVLGRPSHIRFPYTSRYRQLVVTARKIDDVLR